MRAINVLLCLCIGIPLMLALIICSLPIIIISHEKYENFVDNKLNSLASKLRKLFRIKDEN